MSNGSKQIEKISAIIVKLAPKYGIEKAAIFGSLVKGTFGEGSDIDVLVTFFIPIGFFKFIELENELSKALNHKVDLVTKDSLSPYFRDSVLKQMRTVYERNR